MYNIIINVYLVFSFHIVLSIIKIKRIRKATHAFPTLKIGWNFINKKQDPKAELERKKCATLRLRNMKSCTTLIFTEIANIRQQETS